MYASKVGEQKLTFQVSGMLWERSLVMRDLETQSLWSHHLGKAMRGKLKGTELEVIPAVMTTWKEWQRRHPKTSVLAMSRTADRFRAEVWRDPRRFVYVVLLGPGKTPPALALATMQADKLRQFSVGDEHVLVTLSADGQGVQSFNPVIKGRVLTFEKAEPGTMRDQKTRSVWDAVTGRCSAGELKGGSLPERAGMLSFRKSWRAFHPDGKLVSGAETIIP